MLQHTTHNLKNTHRALRTAPARADARPGTCQARPPPPQPPSRCAPTPHTGMAVSPSHHRLSGVWGSSAAWAAVRPYNRRQRACRAGEVRTHRPRDPRFWRKPRSNPTQPNPLIPSSQVLQSSPSFLCTHLFPLHHSTQHTAHSGSTTFPGLFACP